jgi:hypothetical protein
VGSSSERLDSTLDEGSDELDARKLFLRSGSELLDLLHQRLRNLHLLVREIMPPRHARSKDASGLKFLEPEIFIAGGFVLGVVPLRPPAGIVFGSLEVEVFDVRAYLAAETTGLEWQRAPNSENSAPQRPVGLNPQETFTERDEARNV